MATLILIVMSVSLKTVMRLLEIVNPTSSVCGKLMEIVARAKCLKEFEILPDGDLFYNNPSRVGSPEGEGQASVKT